MTVLTFALSRQIKHAVSCSALCYICWTLSWRVCKQAGQNSCVLAVNGRSGQALECAGDIFAALICSSVSFERAKHPR